MNVISQIMRDLPIDKIAKEIGTDPQTASNAAQGIIPVLLQQMTANASTPDGAAGLAGAMNDHMSKDFTDPTGVDLDDSARMLGHIFGSPEQAEQAVAPSIQQAAGLPSGAIRKLMSYIAPLLLAYLANNIFGGGKQQAPAQAPTQAGGGILGSILGSVLGGGGLSPQQAQQQAPAGGTILSDVLGSILGGGAAAPQQQAPQQQAPAQPAGFPNARPEDGMPTMDFPEGNAQAAPQQKNEGGLGGMLKDIFGGGR